MAPVEIQQQMERAAGKSTRVLRWCCPRPGRFPGSCRRNNGIARGEDGATLVEFALVTTAMMTVIFVVMQVCLAFYTYGMICETAREATRWAALRGSTCQTAALTSCTTSAAAITTYAKALYPNIAGGTLIIDQNMFPDADPVSPNPPNCQKPGICHVKVAITYAVPITLPLVPRNSIALSTSSKMYFVQ